MDLSSKYPALVSGAARSRGSLTPCGLETFTSGIWYLASGIWQINHWCPIEALFQNSLEQDIAHSQLARLPGRLGGEMFHTFSSILAFANF